jgi:hypothetical protein
MKFTTRLFFYWVSIFLIFYFGVIGIVYLLWGVRVNFGQAALVFFIVGMIPPAIITAYFSKRLNYMESENSEPPSFKGQKKATFHFKSHSKNPFDEVMQRIDRQWIISFSDRQNHILKFRTDSRMAFWGLGGYLKMEDEETVLVIVYPIFPNSKREKLIINQILRVMGSILNA